MCWFLRAFLRYLHHTGWDTYLKDVLTRLPMQLNLETAVGWGTKQQKASIGGPLRQISASAEQF